MRGWCQCTSAHPEECPTTSGPATSTRHFFQTCQTWRTPPSFRTAPYPWVRPRGGCLAGPALPNPIITPLSCARAAQPAIRPHQATSGELHQRSRSSPPIPFPCACGCCLPSAQLLAQLPSAGVTVSIFSSSSNDFPHTEGLQETESLCLLCIERS